MRAFHYSRVLTKEQVTQDHYSLSNQEPRLFCFVPRFERTDFGVNFTCKGKKQMGELARGSDGRRLFTAEFKRQQIGRVLGGEITHSELCRELDIKSSVVSKWRRLAEQGSQTAVSANEDVVPASQLREAQGRIRELERALGRKTMEVEILQMAQEEIKKDLPTTACLERSCRTTSAFRLSQATGRCCWSFNLGKARLPEPKTRRRGS